MHPRRPNQPLPRAASDDRSVYEVEHHYAFFVDADVVKQERAAKVEAVVTAKGGGGEAFVIARRVLPDLKGVRLDRDGWPDPDQPAVLVEHHFDRLRAAQFAMEEEPGRYGSRF